MIEEIMAEQSLKDKTVKGVAWSGLDNVAQFAISFLIGIVLARLLSPEDYGLIGLTGILVAVCNAFVYGGFYTALVRKKDATDTDFNTVFITNVGTSIFLYVVIFFCSPLIADFFKRTELIALTRVIALGLMIGAFSLVQQVRLTRRIDFKSQAKITIMSSATSGILGIIMAICGFGVWSLVAQQLSNQILRTLLLCFYNKWLPTLQFSWQSFKELFGFGYKLLLSSLLDTTWKELNQVIIGKFYTPASLGQYSRAMGFSNLFSYNLTTVIQRVTFPVLCNIQNDKERMIAAYRRIIKVTMYVTAISMFALGAVSEPLLYCLIGPKWHDAAVYLPLLCISGSLYPLHAINLNMLQVQGRSDLFLGLEIVKKIIALGPLFIGAFVGIMPMLYAGIVVGIISYFLNSYYSGKLLGYSSWMQIKDITPSYAIATVMAIAVYFLKLIPISYWIVLPLQIAVGIIIIFVLSKAAKREEYEELLGIVRPYLAKIREVRLLRH